MIAFLTGRVAARGDGFCLLDVAGVGYKLLMTTPSLAALPHEGDVVTVHTHLHVREDELTLFGFESVAEKSLFEKLITVSGVGPKVALAALSALSPATLTSAITSEDAALVSSVPGIGKKTAERIIIDLRDKLGTPELMTIAGGKGGSRSDGPASAEARDALLSMGFSSAEVVSALKGAPEGDPSALLRHALKRLGGAA